MVDRSFVGHNLKNLEAQVTVHRSSLAAPKLGCSCSSPAVRTTDCIGMGLAVLTGGRSCSEVLRNSTSSVGRSRLAEAQSRADCSQMTSRVRNAAGLTVARSRSSCWGRSRQTADQGVADHIRKSFEARSLTAAGVAGYCYLTRPVPGFRRSRLVEGCACWVSES